MNDTLKSAAENCCCDMKAYCVLLQAMLSASSTAGAHSKLLQHSSCDLQLCQSRVLNGSHSSFRSVTVICIACQVLCSTAAAGATTKAVTPAGI